MPKHLNSCSRLKTSPVGKSLISFETCHASFTADWRKFRMSFDVYHLMDFSRWLGMNDRALYSEKETARGRRLAAVSLGMTRMAVGTRWITLNDIVLDIRV
jgi:hypothetical protein